VVGSAAAAGQEVDVADLAKRVTSDVMGSVLLDQDFGGMEMRWVGGRGDRGSNATVKQPLAAQADSGCSGYLKA
jgi:hypothetical protein